MSDKQDEIIFRALDAFNIELPSWGFANTGTRFGKFLQPAAASTIEDKFSDAAQVHSLTGACPTLALHVQWDLPNGLSDVRPRQGSRQKVRRAARIDQSERLSRSGIQIWVDW
jgi:L-rhamnose isomerase/sugar isomerase